MQWWRAGKSVGVGTVVATFRSAPRPAGASMLVGPGGEAVGSVSGGCVEGAVYELSQEVVESGRPVLQRYGVSDDDAAGRPVAVVTVIEHPEPTWVGRRVVVHPEADGDDEDASVLGSLGSGRADDAVRDDARGLLAQGRSAILTYGPDGERRGEGMRVFVAAHAPKPRM